MTWVYKINAHSFYLNGTYQFDARYSGRPGFKNDSANECVSGKGPLPRGTYTIGPAFFHVRTRAWTMRLMPYPENQMCGRGAFMIHGESSAHPGEASDGCIILDLLYRKIIAASSDKILVVED
ncbi:tlde1 domain-containing protein [Superficieibacter sp. BNK-5]|uniref:tlde1 domain-containing protein n=1 Tax=Superficieibacter sp. BNK-5 TaxID=3376142 RepID=UPI0039BFBE31